MSLGPFLNETIVQDFTTKLSLVSENSYKAKAQGVVYQNFAVTRPTMSQREVLAWLLSTARLRHAGQGGMGGFGSLSMAKVAMTVGDFEDGVEFRENQFTDLDGQGVDLMSKWYADMGAEIAYYPQRELAALMLYGETGLCYDGKAFFASDHPVHPKDSSKGTFANLIVPGTVGGTPLNLDSSQPVEVRLEAITAIKQYLSTIKTPSGDFRKLKIRALLIPPALGANVAQLQGAKFIAQSTTGAGSGSADIEKIVAYHGLGTPIEMDEIGASASYQVRMIDPDDESETTATVTGSNTNYYVLAEEAAGVSTEIPGMIWLEREPVSIQMFNRFNAGGLEAAKARKIWALAHGRAGAQFGLPHFIFKVKP